MVARGCKFLLQGALDTTNYQFDELAAQHVVTARKVGKTTRGILKPKLEHFARIRTAES